MNKITLYEVYTNSDLMEGRGYEVFVGRYIDREIAQRAAKGEGIMGTDAYIRTITAVCIDGLWFKLQLIEIPSEKETKVKQAFDKAKRLGMTEEEIERLSSI